MLNSMRRSTTANNSVFNIQTDRQPVGIVHGQKGKTMALKENGDKATASFVILASQKKALEEEAERLCTNASTVLRTVLAEWINGKKAGE